MRIVFFGTPEFAIPPLKRLHASGHEVAAVVTQPDKPVGRRSVLTPPPVAIAARELSINVLQFERVRSPEAVAKLASLNADLFVTAAYGQILSKKVLNLPKLGTINAHASLLPKLRGAAPINYAIINGESVTGVTTMMTDTGVDTGDILMSTATNINEDETASELSERLSFIAADLLIRTISSLERGELKRTPQNPLVATYAPMLTKETGLIDWTHDAKAIERLIRGVSPWPGAYTTNSSATLKIWKAAVIDSISQNAAPGEVIRSNSIDGLVIMCGKDALRLDEIQAAGGKRMDAKAYLRGKSIPEGTILGAEHAD